MAKIIRWSCPQCDQETHFKGLCRKCTEYDDSGNPTKPVHRVRLNHTQTDHKPQIRTKLDFVNQRRRNPSKKQLEVLKEKLNSHSEALHLQHEHDDFTEVGESLGGEEE